LQEISSEKSSVDNKMAKSSFIISENKEIKGFI
jgi:hypothetical protein